MGSVLLTLVSLAGGCAGGKAYRQGRAAEKRGDAHLAYEYYYSAAERNPDNSTVAAAIKRVAPTAATYWHSQARIAWTEGRYPDAWRMAMRGLEIRPDHPGALELIRQLETQHPTTVASAKQAWSRRGSKALVSADQARSVPGEGSKGADGRDSVAMATHAAGGSASGRSSAETERAAQADGRSGREPGESPRNRAKRSRGPARHIKFPIIRTLSKKDERYDRRMKAVDGIAIKLRDTDDDLDVDLDLLKGDKRIQKIRELRIGGSKLFQGRSGTWYRLTVLDIRHKTRTVRLSIKPA